MHVYQFVCNTLVYSFCEAPFEGAHCYTTLSILLQAMNYTQTLASPLSSKLTPSHPVGHFMRRRVSLSPGANYSIVIPALNPEDKNSVVNVLFQVPTSAGLTHGSCVVHLNVV